MNTGNTHDRRFVHSRVIDAALEQVFAAFSRPERLARWWGPEGFTSTFEVFEFRTGGSWKFVMHGPDGSNYPNVNVFTVVDSTGRVEVEHISEDHHFFLNIAFAREDGRTRVGWEQTFDTVEHKQGIAQWVEPANEQNLERLAREVARGEAQSAA